MFEKFGKLEEHTKGNILKDMSEIAVWMSEIIAFTHDACSVASFVPRKGARDCPWLKFLGHAKMLSQILRAMDEFPSVVIMGKEMSILEFCFQLTAIIRKQIQDGDEQRVHLFSRAQMDDSLHRRITGCPYSFWYPKAERSDFRLKYYLS